MRAPKFIVASATTHRDVLITLHTEYLAWVFDEIERAFGVPANHIVGMSA